VPSLDLVFNQPRYSGGAITLVFGAPSEQLGVSLKYWDGVAFVDAPLMRWSGVMWVNDPAERLKRWGGAAWT
jgi:hypothetical protein